MKKIIVLTDIHIVHPGQTILGIDPTARLDAAIDQIHKTSSDADMVIITGDLTDQGHPDCYERLKASLSRLKLPHRLLIGNHDSRANFQAAFPDAPKDANGFVQFFEDIDDWRLICLDSVNQPRIEGTRHGSGQICEKRYEFLENALSGANDRRVIIFLHHPPFISGFPGMDAIRLMEAEKFISVLKGHGNVQLVVSGHIHRTMSAVINGVPQALFKSTAHEMPLDFVSPNSSIACIEPPAYGILLLTDEGVVVHTEDYLWPPVTGESLSA